MRFRPITGFLTFVLAVSVLVVLLKFLNWIPLAMQQNMLRQYAGIEQVKSSLKIADIYVPSYFPEQINWPPSNILAQDKPFPAVLMEFRQRGGEQVVLVMSQCRGGSIKSEHALEPSVVRETVPFTLHDTQAVLTVGECPDHEVCSAIAWSEGGYALQLSMKSTPFVLTKIAQSMHP